ncbi:cytochrome c oxidase subunit 3 [Mesorhizobium sp. ANAO-SY3R2]|uniref:cytochrome c oxidase subunit 3 n=1 Tax=Mesorhizobium sp. ANAO-SY3R2 TaxID=3166644 RepID=UPI00366BDD5B
MDVAVSNTRAGDDPDAGEFLLWILVWSELAAFGILLVAFQVAGLVQADQFASARRHLNAPLAALNTAMLLTSGWQAARAARPDATRGQARIALIVAALFGLVFVAIKLFEYSGEIVHAGDEAYGVFFELYFLLTGFHLLHVAFGALVLLLVSLRMERSNMVLITTLWHIFDLIWIVMFPLVYLA